MVRETVFAAVLGLALAAHGTGARSAQNSTPAEPSPAKPVTIPFARLVPDARLPVSLGPGAVASTDAVWTADPSGATLVRLDATKNTGDPPVALAGPACASLAVAFDSVWAPLCAKAAAVLAGMLALAAIGASSLARGSGVAVPPAPARAGRGGATVASLDAPSLARSAHAGALDVEPRDAGAGTGDGGSEAPRPPSDAVTADGKIILNLASESDLRHLPGIGAKRAAAILALRAKLGGRFKRLTDLLRVKGIGPKGLKKLEPRVVLDAPKPA
jgi:competence protein ComEA